MISVELLMQTVGQLIVSNLVTIIGVVGAIAAVIAAVASVKALYPISKPAIEKPKVWLSIHHPNTRHNSGSFLAKNDGPKPCSITDVAVRCSTISLPDYNLVAVNHWPSAGVGINGTQKLPLSIEGYGSKQIFFRTEDVPETYKGELPDSVKLEVRLDCKPRIIVKSLHRQGNTDQYQ